jgi:hypothetical protein
MRRPADLPPSGLATLLPAGLSARLSGLLAGRPSVARSGGLPSGATAGERSLRRFGGFALLGLSLWLVALLAFFRAVVGVFS